MKNIITQELPQAYDSVELWKALVESTPDLVIVADTGSTIRYINRVGDGVCVENTIGKTLYEYIPEVEHDKMRQAIDQVISSGAPQHFEITGAGHSQTTAWYESRMIPIKRAGEVIGLILISSDITRRKELEQAQNLLAQRQRKACEEAEAAKEKSANILGSITDGFFSLDQDWCIAYANVQAARSVNKRLDDLIGQNFWDTFPEAKDSAFGAEYRRCMRERTPSTVDAFYPPLGRWFDVKCYPSSNGISVFFQDVSQQKLAEQALQESERRFRSVFEQSSVSMAITDSQYRFLQVNQAFCRLLGYSEAELLHLSVMDITHPADRLKNGYQRDKSVAAAQPAVDIEKRYLHKDGSVVWGCVSGVFIYNEHQELQYAVAVIQDMTRHKELEAARQELLRRLLATQEDERLRISRELHDQMGQDLAALLLGLETLPEQTRLQPAGAQKVQELQDVTRHIMEQARALALGLRPEALGRLGLAVALQRKVKDWTRRTGIPVEFHSNNILDQSFPAEIEMTLYRVVQEALTNVLRHAQATQVTLLLEHRKDQIALIIEDDGRGFDADAVLASQAPVTNLGLLGMRERVSLVNGTMDIESSAGSGVSIFVRIPFKGK